MPAPIPLILTLALLAPQEHSTPLKLSGTLLGGDVEDFELVPGGTHVVFRAPLDTPSVAELYVAPLDGSRQPKRLNRPVQGGAVGTYSLSQDGGRVLYTAPEDAPSVYELYVVPVDRSVAPTKLSGPLVALGDVELGRFAPDGTWVLYRADQDTNGVQELYAVPSSGASPAHKVNGALVLGGEVTRDFAFSPDGTRLMYVADQDTNDVLELFSAPVDGSAPAVKLNGALVAGGDVVSFAFSPDGTRAVYLADQDVDARDELFGVPVDGSLPAVKLNTPLTSGRIRDYAISSDGVRVVYVASGLYSAPLDGSGAPTSLSAPCPTPGYDFEITHDARYVVWSSDGGGFTGADGKVKSVRLKPGVFPPVELESYTFSSIGSISSIVSPDSTRVVYNPVEYGASDLYSVGTTGFPWPVLLTTLPAPVSVEEYRIGATSENAYYRGETFIGGLDLWTVPLDGSAAPRALNGPQGEVEAFATTADDRCVVYLADQETPGVDELYSTCRLALDAVLPNGGALQGGTPVYLKGFGFTPSTRVWFDDRPAKVVVRPRGDRVVVLTPALAQPAIARGGRSGVRLAWKRVDVRIQDGAAEVVLPGAFTYHP